MKLEASAPRPLEIKPRQPPGLTQVPLPGASHS